MCLLLISSITEFFLRCIWADRSKKKVEYPIGSMMGDLRPSLGVGARRIRSERSSLFSGLGLKDSTVGGYSRLKLLASLSLPMARTSVRPILLLFLSNALHHLHKVTRKLYASTSTREGTAPRTAPCL